jgi:4'-phosphopantetheinyl transferase
VLARTVLGRYLDVAPGELRFTVGAHGRPELSSPALPTPFRFNLSNTRGLVACLVSGDHEGGIDVENMTRKVSFALLAERCFAPAELGVWKALPEDAKVDRFFELWTLKESYLKARGAGMSLPLGQFGFDFDADKPRITMEPALGDDARDWAFSAWNKGADHRVAVGIRGLGVELQRFEVTM